MWQIVRRIVLPLLLTVAGLASLVYGTMFRSVPVLEDRETTTTVNVPTGVLPLPSGQEMPMGGPPEFIKRTVATTVQETVSASEPALMRDCSVGGVELLASGLLKRTHRGDEDGPALCPS